MKIAVVGGGISGLASALILDPHHEVHLFESESRLGGHAHTVRVQAEAGEIPMDTGFLVYNTLTYPHFTRFLEFLEVTTVESDMSLSIQTPTGLEWAGTNLGSVFAQKRNLFNPRFLRMLKHLLSFNRRAYENLELSRKNSWTLGELVENEKLSSDLLSWYLLPMTGAIWSMPYLEALEFPAESFLTFCINHRLLQVNQRPVWRTIKGGSIEYVKKVGARLKNVHLSAPIRGLKRSGDRLILNTPSGQVPFDRVVFATHAPVTRAILGGDFPKQESLLKDLKTSSNQVFLHRDATLMPRSKKCWSSWNVESPANLNENRAIHLTYYLNKLQPLQTQTDYFITLNPTHQMSFIERDFVYDHPKMDFNLLRAQTDLDSIQGVDGVYLSGAWTRYGFHEDGVLSAVRVAEKMNLAAPWN